MKLNYIAIVLGIILNFGLARVWYGSFFNSMWRSLTNRTADEKPEKSRLVVALIFALLMSLGVNILINLLAITSFGLILVVSMTVAFLFIAPVILGEWIWDKKSFTLVALNTGFYVIYFIGTFLLFAILK
jgi:hypothetical protein